MTGLVDVEELFGWRKVNRTAQKMGGTVATLIPTVVTKNASHVSDPFHAIELGENLETECHVFVTVVHDGVRTLVH